MSKKEDTISGLIASIVGIGIASLGLSVHDIAASHFLINAAPPASILISGFLAYLLKFVFYTINDQGLKKKLWEIDNQLSSPKLDAKTIKELNNMRNKTSLCIINNINSLTIVPKEDGN
jgi:hypothetical protein